MSSQVLARKYRPQSFEEVAGQDTTVQILKNALIQKRLHHAYLLTGPRGTGKTSLARIIAKAVNCDQGPTPLPCQQCTSCKEITEGRSLSVIEIDGASNTSVEDVRDLRDKIRYLPAGGRYKIYIIDEVHMLSTAAFNALLKTLEEPPPHALFLFATTDPQKMPATVISRLIRLDLRAISRSTIVNQLKKIAGEEKLQVDESILYRLAGEARGGLRDALSLLDQIISFCGLQVTVQQVNEILGVSTNRFTREIIDAILDKDAVKVLKVIEEATAAGIEPKRLATDLLESFRHLLVAQVSQESQLFDLPVEEIKELAERASKINPTDLDALFRILQKGLTDLARSPYPKILLDVLLLRLAHFEGLRPLEELREMMSQPALRPAQKPLLSPIPVAKFSPPVAANKNWSDFLVFLKTKKPQISAIVEAGQCLLLDSNRVTLQFPANSIQAKLLEEPDRSSALREVMTAFFGKSMELTISTPSGPSQTSTGKTSNIVDEAISIFSPQKVVNQPGKLS